MDDRRGQAPSTFLSTSPEPRPLAVARHQRPMGTRRWTVPDRVCKIVCYQPKAEERGNGKPRYILLSSLTDEGASTVKKNPERIKEVNKDVEALGGLSLIHISEPTRLGM